METQKRESWGSSIGFILAIAGSAVGLGNVWKFPYITGLNGGGAFVLVYLFCILLVGMPVMLCEIVIGRRTRKNPYGAFKALQLRCRDLRGQRGCGRMRIRKRGVFLKRGNKLRVCAGNVRHGCGILTGLLSLSAQKAKAEFFILGAQLMCSRATDIVAELATAIVNGLTCAQLAGVIRPHPTFCEGVTEAVEDVHAMAIHLAPKKR